jgi:hypothetical protein
MVSKFSIIFFGRECKLLCGGLKFIDNCHVTSKNFIKKVTHLPIIIKNGGVK